MKLLLGSFWRAAAYCLHPKVVMLSLLPLLIGAALALGLGWLYWEPAVAAVRATLEGWQLVDAGLKWVEALAGNSFRAVLAPLIVVGLAAPVIAVLSVLLVAGAVLVGLKVADAASLCHGGESGQLYLRLWPQRHATDGFFAAVWQKK